MNGLTRRMARRSRLFPKGERLLSMTTTANSRPATSRSDAPATAHVDTFTRDNLPPRELWPAFIFTRPELQYPARINCAAHFLDRWVAQGRGDQPCIFSNDANYTYSELQALVNRIANVLVNELGLVTGGRVLRRPVTNPMRVATFQAGRQAVGVEVPNLAPRMVTLGDIFDGLTGSASPLSAPCRITSTL